MLLLSPAASLAGQDTPYGYAGLTRSIILLGSPEEDRIRVAQLFGRASVAGSLIRSPSSTPGSVPNDSSVESGFRWSLVPPVVDAVWNSQVPFSLDEGNLWAGRGLSSRVTGGVRGNAGPVQFLIMPDVVHSENRAFNFLPSTVPGRSAFSSPFLSGAVSADTPTRFGNEPLTILDAGQSAIWLPYGWVDVGASTENQWWGPALQNALVMSDNAPGIPELFVRTNRPIRSTAGTFEGKAMVGGLTESLFFDDSAGNDHRAISGIVATFAPALAPDLTFGVARAVYANVDNGSPGDVLSHSLDALIRWRGTRPRIDSTGHNGYDQVSSLFGRWVFPASGLEVYAEWARMLPPTSLRALLLAPQYTQGYTLGLQAAGHVQATALLRFQGEFTDLEQTPASRAADTLSFYTSDAVPQGYTQRGRAIGAAIGPGGSSQFLALDYLESRWNAGLFAQRIRWDDDAYYLQPTGISFFAHDVTVLAGVRGTARLYGSELHAELSVSQRLNYMFQNLRGGFGVQRQNDLRNTTFKVWIAPWSG